MTSSLVVTTGLKPPPELEERALAAASELAAPYHPRFALSLPRLFAQTGAARALVLGRDRMTLYDALTGACYYFHPNLALPRSANARQGRRDLFLEATNLSPSQTLLDCTLGFAAEASLASIQVGTSGEIVGLESVLELAFVTRQGLQTFPMRDDLLREAMRRIVVITSDYRDYLPRCADRSFDVVYFDPFFEARLPGSEKSVNPLFIFGNPTPLDADSVREAQRLCRRRVVIKHPSHEPLPLDIEAKVTEQIRSRKSRLVYSVLERV